MTDHLVLDVETTGLSRRTDVITTACWYFRGTWYRWVRDLDSPAVFQSHWAASSALVTFNGRNFDEKFVVKDLGVEPHPVHCDVMHEGWKRGLKGGLKRVAIECGLPRPPEIEGMDGRTAILLWDRWQGGDAAALELLSLYNAWDVWLTLGLYRQWVLGERHNEVHGIPWQFDAEAAGRLLGGGRFSHLPHSPA
ncbi:MAG: ribonuclease H-like domain-containing protein [Phycisphaerales bacterium]|nr:ribonuclease H-like domain-containing protein [Phycisphaerales bacterium]